MGFSYINLFSGKLQACRRLCSCKSSVGL